jgi:hypothetical protein
LILLGTLVLKNQHFLHSGHLDDDQFRALNSIRICRTTFAAGVVYGCDNCEITNFVYHSCGNRFCPNCQNHKTSLWLHRQKERLLACNYFMITLTVPAELRRIPRRKRKQFFEAFFEASSNAIKELTYDRLGGTPGMVGVLHTNSRTLGYHPHIHYIVPAIVINKGENTVKKITKKYFLHQQALANLFRGKLLSKLTRANIQFPKHLYGIKWQVDCDLKGNGASALEYLSRYLIKGVVSQNALSYTQDGNICLNYIESKTKIHKSKEFTEADFLKTLANHVLPKGFRRIREYGFLAPAAKRTLTKIQLIYHAKPPIEPKPQAPKVLCKCCKKPMKILIHKVHEEWYIRVIGARPPPYEHQ